jgi:hypothetical protein
MQKREDVGAMTLLIITIISLGFLAAIPVKANTQVVTDTEVNTRLVFTISAVTQGKETRAFEIAIEKSKIEVLLRGSLEEFSKTKTFTQEQLETIMNSDNITIMSGDNYLQVVAWYEFFGIPYGAYCHLHLDALTAINTQTAIVVGGGLITLIAAFTVPPAVPVAGFLTAVWAYDYGNMYSIDHNADDSFDLWFEVAPWTVYMIWGGSMLVSTKTYLWMVTIAGAWTLRDYRDPPPPPPPPRGSRGYYGFGGGGNKFMR